MLRLAIAFALTAGAAGCFEAELVDCGDHVCPVGYACTADSCRATGTLVACIGADPACDTGLALRLDLPSGALAPAGFTALTATLRHADGTSEIVTGRGGAGGVFELGAVDPAVSEVEVTLRNDAGGTLGYGRVRGLVGFPAGPIMVPVRRPLVYLAGSAFGASGPAAPTILDLAEPGDVTGGQHLPSIADGVATAGSALFLAERDEATASIAIRAVDTRDHIVGAVVAMAAAGAPLLTDVAGDEEGGPLALGTEAGLYRIDPATGTVRQLAAQGVGRVIATGDSVAGIARLGKFCSGASDLLVDDTNVGSDLFVDLATDHGRLYILTCGGDVFEVVDGALQLRAQLGSEARSIAVANRLVYVVSSTPDFGFALVRIDLESGEIFELVRAQVRQVVSAQDYPGVQRELLATGDFDADLAIGAGGQLVALLLRTTHNADRVPAANVPDMGVRVEELRVFDATSGAALVRYRSQCRVNTFNPEPGDIANWVCATEPGQTAPQPADERGISSIAISFGSR